MTQKMSGNSPKKILSASPLCLLVIALFWVCLQISSAYEVGAPIPPEEFGDDYYKVYGTPNLTLSLERSNVDLNSEMVSMLVSQRAYAASAQVVRAADELLTLANNLRR